MPCGTPWSVTGRVAESMEPMPSPAPPRCCLIVPVKPPARAKSRLAPLGDEAREALATAFVIDTVSAALETSRVGAVLVVTDDHRLAVGLHDLGAYVIPDAVADDLNESLVQAGAEAARRWPYLAPAAMCADLPALSPEDLDAALTAAATHDAAVVGDVNGDGTTLLVARSLETFTPRFGSGSREAHVAAGAHDLVEIDVPTLRRDVDTPDDLRDALALGVGRRTALVARSLRL